MRIFRPQATKPIPAGAKVDREKKTVAYKAHSRTHKAILTDNGRMRIECAVWHVEFRDHLDRRQHVTAFTHEGQSRLLASQIERLVSLIGQPLPMDLVRPIENLPSRIKDQLVAMGLLEGKRTAAGRTLEELLTEFEQSLRAQERNGRYVDDTLYVLRRMFEDCGFKHFSDISANRVETYLKDLRSGNIVRPGEQKTRKLSFRRSNIVLRAAKGFCTWLVRRGYAYESPLAPLKMLDDALDRRHVRRALDLADLRQLLHATATGPETFGMSGTERFLLYRFVVETGLRANEIRQLRRGDFDFESHTVKVAAANAKGRREDIQHLSPGLSHELRIFMQGKLPDAKAFGGRFKSLTDKTADMIQEDLARAEIPYQDESGRVFDFHALRGQCETLLAASGVSMKTAQTILRHTDVNLTANVYTHVLRGQEAQAVASLPDLSLGSLQAEQAVKTGTDDRDVTAESLRRVCFPVERDRTASDSIGQVTVDGDSKTALVMQNPGPGQPPELQVACSSHAGDSSQVQKSQALTESNPTTEVGKAEKFGESLRGQGGNDPEDIEIMDALPRLPPDIKRMILHVIRNSLAAKPK